MITFFIIIQILLALGIIFSIIFSKSSSNFINSITNNFSGGALNSRSKLNIRPRTKIMFLLLILFFSNSIFLTKKISDSSDKNTTSIIKKSTNDNSTKSNVPF